MSLSIGSVNSINTNFYTKASNKIKNNEDGINLFDNTSAFDKSVEDVAENNQVYEEIKAQVQAKEKDEKTTEYAKAKAEQIKNTWGGKTNQLSQSWNIAGEPYVDKNKVYLVLQDDSGNYVGTKAFEYGNDGSYVVTSVINGIRVDEYREANGQIRKREQTNPDGSVKKYQYDETGKLNQEQFYSADKKTTTTSWFDDNGQKIKTVKDDGVNVSTTMFEYDSDDPKALHVGSYNILKNKKTGEETKTTLIYDRANGTAENIMINPDGTKILNKYKLDNKGNYYKTSQVNKDKNDNITKSQTFGERNYKSDGSFTQDVTVKENGKTYYQTNTSSKDNKLTKQVRYSDKNKTKKVGEWSYTYNKGHKTQMTRIAYNSDGSKTTTIVKYDPDTGKEISRKSETTGKPKPKTSTSTSSSSNSYSDYNSSSSNSSTSTAESTSKPKHKTLVAKSTASPQIRNIVRMLK